ncbi:MAG: hydrogenase expression/formation protein HypE [Aquificae bacterium]|nr:hydrogenase expression/formation protein HypE [Aquificota bacterium]
MRKILLAHGSGGEETHRLIKEVFLRYFSNEYLNELEDSARLPSPRRLAYTTDAFTVSPIFFPGGDIGKLAVAGTVNDLAVSGAKPLYIALSFIIEEGLSVDELERVVRSASEEAKRSGVLVVAGDTKVVPKGQADKLYIGASGIGEVVYEGLSSRNLSEGDVIIVSGSVGEHGACILALREGLDFELPLVSDCRSLWGMIERLISSGVQLKAMRDATRGGLSGVLNEWATASGVDIELEEESIPVKDAVRGLCELLGFEPLHLASEGVAVIAVSPEDAERALGILRETPEGAEARIIGRVIGKGEGRVLLRTPYGVSRILEPPSGELLPRIC